MPKPTTAAPNRPATSVAVLTFEVKAAANQGATGYRVLPAGEFTARDGRPAINQEGKPTGIKAWRMNATIAARLISQASQAGVDFVADYEHQTLQTETNGQPAPAAGWWKQLEWREGDGLYITDLRWTDRAKAFIDSDEYRYISPVFEYDSTGAPTRLRHIALTNDPALDRQAGLQAALSARFSPAASLNQETEMDLLAQLLAVLKLPAATTEQEAVAAVTALQTTAAQVPDLNTQITALKTAAPATPNPAEYVPVATVTALQGEVAALRNAQTDREVGEVVDGALKGGKLLPAQEGWARDLGKSNLAALKDFVAKAPVVAPVQTQTGGKEPDGSPAATAATDLAVCRQLGISAEDFAKTTA